MFSLVSFGQFRQVNVRIYFGKSIFESQFRQFNVGKSISAFEFNLRLQSNGPDSTHIVDIAHFCQGRKQKFVP